MAAVSIVIPVYNKEKYLSATLNAVLQQSYQDYEVILIDDGSTDRSLDICKAYAGADGRICVYTQPNGGVSKARNFGLRKARGTWIQFLDGDDIITNNYLEAAVHLGESEGADIVFSGFSKVDTSGNYLSTLKVPVQTSVDPGTLCRLFVEHQYLNGFFGFISNKLFRRELLYTTKAEFPEGIPLAEDLDFYSRLYCGVQKVAFWDGDSFLYLQTDENYRYKSDINYLDQLKIQVDIRRWFIAVEMYETYSRILDRQICKYVYYALFDANERKKDLKHVCEQLAEETCTVSCAQRGSGRVFERRILKAYSKGQVKRIKVMFWMRGVLRTIYRERFKP